MFKEALMQYLDALRIEGFDCIHATNVIPFARGAGVLRFVDDSRDKWTQFPKIDSELLAKYNIQYDQGTGWFTL